jgi:hypothetical protein
LFINRYSGNYYFLIDINGHTGRVELQGDLIITHLTK